MFSIFRVAKLHISFEKYQEIGILFSAFLRIFLLFAAAGDDFKSKIACISLFFLNFAR